jgi:hypothetical protein
MHPRCNEGYPRITGYFQRHLFQTKKVGDIKTFFVDYSDSKRVHLKPDIVEYACNGVSPAYNLILGKQPCTTWEWCLISRRRQAP